MKIKGNFVLPKGIRNQFGNTTLRGGAWGEAGVGDSDISHLGTPPPKVALIYDRENLF
jgi:hypothetical protein